MVSKKAEENLIHIKLEYEEGVDAKRDILTFEKDLLHFLKRMKNYHKYRSEELKYKIKTYNKIKELRSSLNKLNVTFPKIEIPEILSKGREEYRVEKKTKLIGSEKDLDLDMQLQEIQDRLRDLE